MACRAITADAIVVYHSWPISVWTAILHRPYGMRAVIHPKRLKRLKNWNVADQTAVDVAVAMLEYRLISLNGQRNRTSRCRMPSMALRSIRLERVYFIKSTCLQLYSRMCRHVYNQDRSLVFASRVYLYYYLCGAIWWTRRAHQQSIETHGIIICSCLGEWKTERGEQIAGRCSIYLARRRLLMPVVSRFGRLTGCTNAHMHKLAGVCGKNSARNVLIDVKVNNRNAEKSYTHVSICVWIRLNQFGGVVVVWSAAVDCNVRLRHTMLAFMQDFCFARLCLFIPVV